MPAKSPTRPTPRAGSAREIARAVLERIERTKAFPNRVLSTALDRARDLSPEDRSLATELVYGTLRRQSRLDRALEAVSDRGLTGIDPRVRIALRVAAYQMLFLDRIPPYAAVNDAVDACKGVRGRSMAGLANALLRRLGERGEPPLPRAADDPAGYLIDACGLPEWLARLMLVELPVDEAVALANALSTPAPLTLRANSLRADREALRSALLAERPDADLIPHALAPHALMARRLDLPFATQAFKQGLFAVEDAGAQMVAELCGAAAGERILDACAGLGGKTAHLAGLAQNQADIEAADVAPAKLSQAREALHRLGVKGVTTRVADLTTEPASEPYHRILLDAPCSGLGVLRRHPEAALRRTPADVAALAVKQRLMLDAAAKRLMVGGILVYAVCTFDRAESEDVVTAFLAANSAFEIAPPTETPWAALADERGFVRTWPHRHDADAFFAARMRRNR